MYKMKMISKTPFKLTSKVGQIIIQFTTYINDCVISQPSKYNRQFVNLEMNLTRDTENLKKIT